MNLNSQQIKNVEYMNLNSQQTKIYSQLGLISQSHYTGHEAELHYKR
jgi:hypothetical protein